MKVILFLKTFLLILHESQNVFSQVLLTKPDLQNNDSRANLRATMEELLRMNCIPVINANDVVTSPPGPEVDLTGV